MTTRETERFCKILVKILVKTFTKPLTKREGKELMKVQNASLQQLLAGSVGQTGSRLYAIAANPINQALLGFTETTTHFKKQQELPQQ